MKPGSLRREIGQADKIMLMITGFYGIVKTFVFLIKLDACTQATPSKTGLFN
jgi:hypothetical protein